MVVDLVLIAGQRLDDGPRHLALAGEAVQENSYPDRHAIGCAAQSENARPVL